MSIVLTSATNVSQGSGTYALTISGTHPMLIVGIAHSSDAITSVVFNTTQTMTEVPNTKVTAFGGYTLYLYYLINPTTGTHNLVINVAPVVATAMLYGGVLQSAPKNGVNTTGNGGTGISTISAYNGDWLVGGATNIGSAITAGTNTTLRSVASSSGQFDSNGVASPTALNYTWTSSQWATNGAAIEPYPPFGGNFLPFL